MLIELSLLSLPASQLDALHQRKMMHLMVAMKVNSSSQKSPLTIQLVQLSCCELCEFHSQLDDLIVAIHHPMRIDQIDFDAGFASLHWRRVSVAAFAF